MPDASKQPLAYAADSLAFAQHLHDLPGFVWLESGSQEKPGIDIISALPGLELLLNNGQLVQRTPVAEVAVSGNNQPIADTVIELLSESPNSDWIGYLAYDAVGEVSGLRPHIQPYATPNVQLCRYDWALIVDHASRTAFIQWHQGCSAATREQVRSRLKGPTDTKDSSDFNLQAPFRPDQTQSQYAANFHRIQEYIREGDCYQVNYAQRFSTGYQGDPWHAFLALRQVAKAPYGAFLRTPAGAILSLSPEQFIQIDGQHIRTAPIKGTRARGQNPAEDLALEHELAASSKDRAENLMIVDLLRNDLGRHSDIGSVKVERLFEIQTYRNVHHLVSTISATLKAGTHPLRLFFDAFPGGSITGAPKRRAMEIIAELEPHRRSVYCGS